MLRENEIKGVSGWMMLVLLLVVSIASFLLLIGAIAQESLWMSLCFVVLIATLVCFFNVHAMTFYSPLSIFAKYRF